MIPQFPEFKLVELTDREAVEAYTHRYPPCSDFNFTSLWVWDTSGERMLSELNGNLVVRFTDYSTHEQFLSFLGTSETEHAARTLLEYCKAEGLPDVLRLMPEASVKDMRSSVISVVEDRDNFDYVYSISDLAALRGQAFEAKRKIVNKFRRENPDAHTESVDLSNVDVQKKISTVLRSWEKNKVDQAKEYELAHEEMSIQRLFDTADSHELIVTGLFIKEQMAAFSIEEILPDQYCIGHFWKADTKYPGIYDFLIHEKCRHFETLGLSFLNYEQDLGVPGLRASKTSFRPTLFLKKYAVKLAQAE